MSKEEEEYKALPWCHIYAQYIWHGEAKIQGTRAALTSIRDAIDKALSTGMDGESETLYTRDGEGYGVKVSIRSHDYLERQPLPYTAAWAGGVGQASAEHEAKENARLEKEREKLNAAR